MRDLLFLKVCTAWHNRRKHREEYNVTVTNKFWILPQINNISLFSPCCFQMRGTVVSDSEFKICEASQIEVIMWPLVNFRVTEIWIFLGIESSLEQKQLNYTNQFLHRINRLRAVSLFSSSVQQNAREYTRAWLKARDSKCTKKERLPAQPQRMVFHGLLICWRKN